MKISTQTHTRSVNITVKIKTTHDGSRHTIRAILEVCWDHQHWILLCNRLECIRAKELGEVVGWTPSSKPPPHAPPPPAQLGKHGSCIVVDESLARHMFKKSS